MQNWQLAEQAIVPWHRPDDVIPHGEKQKLHCVLLTPQYKQFATVQLVLLVAGLYWLHKPYELIKYPCSQTKQNGGI